jgi:DNA-binding Lrp family transcriptional regulator
MKLTEKEKNILACVELRADMSVAQIRKETGYQEHVIRYHLKRLVDRGIVTVIPFINLHTLGFTIFNIFFSMSAPQKTRRHELIKTLNNLKQVVWVGEFSGDYQLGIAVSVKNLHELTEILNFLTKKFSGVFFEKSFSCQFSASMFYRKYLASKKFNQKALTSAVHSKSRALDEIDEKILQGLNLYRDTSHRDIAQQLKMPLSSFELRLKKMEKDQIVAGYIYAVDPSKFDIHSFKLLIYARGQATELSAQLFSYAEKHRNITYFIQCLGSWDYEIGVEVEKPEQVIDVTQDLYEAFGGSINKISLLTKFRDLKFSWYPVSK